jgi:hypothetical protein
MGSGLGVPVIFPSGGLMARRFLPSAGSLGSVPPPRGYYGALRLPVARPAALRRLRLAVSRSHPSFAPAAAGCAGRGPGVGHPVPPAGDCREGGGASQVPGEPPRTCPVLRPRRDRVRQASCGAATRPSVRMTTSAPATLIISGLNSTARSLAVYASQCRLPGHHARLASGRWPSFAGRGLVPRRVPTRSFRVTLASSSPKLSWRTTAAILNSEAGSTRSTSSAGRA